MTIAELLNSYQTLVAGIISSTSIVGVILAARITVSGQVEVLNRQRSEQHEEDRRSAGLLIWAEVRVIRRGALEWVAKYKRRMLDETAGNAVHGERIAVPRSTEIYKSHVLRLARFPPSLIQQIVYFYSCMEVYAAFLDRPVTPSVASGEEAASMLSDAEELATRADKLAALIYGDLFPNHVEPPHEEVHTNPAFSPFFDDVSRRSSRGPM